MAEKITEVTTNTARVDPRPHTFEEAVQRTIEDINANPNWGNTPLDKRDTPAAFAEEMKKVQEIINENEKKKKAEKP